MVVDKMNIHDGTKHTRSHWHTFFLGKEHKPLITVDFDHTITMNCPACPSWNGEYIIQVGVREALENLHETFEIVILSGGGNFVENYGEIIRSTLMKNHIPFDRIEDRKPPACFMVDDRAIHHKGWVSTVHEIAERMKH